MLDTAAPAPVLSGRLTRLAVPAAAATAALNAALAVVQLLAPAQPAGSHHFVRATDYVIEILFAASLLATAWAVGLLSRYHRRIGRWGTLGIIAASAYALGTGLFGISAAATAARGVNTLDPIQLPAIGLWLAAGLLMAIATVRARVLPIVICLGFAAGLPASIALGHAGSLVLALLWAALATALARYQQPPVDFQGGAGRPRQPAPLQRLVRIGRRPAPGPPEPAGITKTKERP